MARRKPTSERKIGVKHYLNRKLKPVIVHDIEYYPVYLRITFEGKMTEVKSSWFYILNYNEREAFFNKEFDLYDAWPYLSEDIFNNDSDVIRTFGFEKAGIETLIRYINNKFNVNPIRSYQPSIYEQIAVNLKIFVSMKAYDFYLKETIFWFDKGLVQHVTGNSPDFESCISALHKYFKEEIVIELEKKNPKIRFISNLLNKFHDDKHEAWGLKAYHIISPHRDTLLEFLNNDELNYLQTIFDNWVHTKKQID
jgi:hypothetical protein